MALAFDFALCLFHEAMECMEWILLPPGVFLCFEIGACFASTIGGFIIALPLALFTIAVGWIAADPMRGLTLLAVGAIFAGVMAVLRQQVKPADKGKKFSSVAQQILLDHSA